MRWQLATPVVAVDEADSSGRILRGVEAEVTVDAVSLEVKQALLSSIRVLRDYEGAGVVPDSVEVVPKIESRHVSWARNRLDGAAGYKISLEVLSGRLDGDAAAVRISGDGGPPIRLKIRALTGESPLTPLDGSALLTADAGKDTGARNALAFLSYREKFLAGSWRFNTYFGRDTLMSLRLLMPVLQPDAVESGLKSVLSRLAPNGEVAHEEDIGEFAILRHLRDTDRASATPIYDYGMIDDDFMLPPVAAAWLLDEPRGRSEAARFLGSDEVGERLARNLLWVVRRTAHFAEAPIAANLVSIKPGRKTGQWRDSEEGLGRGAYAYDVNAVFVPAALDAAHRFAQSGLLDRFLTGSERVELLAAADASQVWRDRAPRLFETSIPGNAAAQAIATYSADIGVDAPGHGSEDTVRFDALALDAQGQPVPVMHSDVGFALLFGAPAPAAIERALDTVLNRFPAGLATDAGILVANPVFGDAGMRQRFGRGAYHGTVIWSWQHAVLLAGIDRQSQRADLSPELHARLAAAREAIASTVAAQRGLRQSELWTWTYRDGRFHAAAFGQDSGDEDESNAAQLWSTVFLALDGVGRE